MSEKELIQLVKNLTLRVELLEKKQYTPKEKKPKKVDFAGIIPISNTKK